MKLSYQMLLNSGWTYDRQIMYDQNNFTANADLPNVIEKLV